MSRLKYLALALGALAFASMIAVSGPSKAVEAQAVSTPHAATFEKLCEGDVEGPFTIDVDVEFEPNNETDVPNVNEDTEFDYTVVLECDDVEVIPATDGDSATGTDVDNFHDYLDSSGNYEGSNFFDWFFGLCEATCPEITITVGEEMEGVISEFEGDCPEIVINDEISLEAFAIQFDEEGLLCTITNIADLEAIPDLIITKECLSGDGDGDADFNVVVSTELGAEVDLDSLDCGDVMAVADLDEGTYRIQEFITGPDANLFLTAIVCTTADGQTVTPGQLAEVELELGFDVECSIINVFDADGDGVIDPGEGAPPAPPTVIVPIDLDNTNTNTLDNVNDNGNNNVNTNTQEQANEQKQVNDNNQTTTVNSSPSVVITGLPRATQAAAPTIPGPGPTIITGPSTGEAGLVNW